MFSEELIDAFKKISQDSVNPIFSNFLYEIGAIVIHESNYTHLNTEGMTSKIYTFLEKEFVKQKEIEKYFNYKFKEVYDQLYDFIYQEKNLFRKSFQDDNYLQGCIDNLSKFYYNTQKFYEAKFSLNLNIVLKGFWEKFKNNYRNDFNYFLSLYQQIMGESNSNSKKRSPSSVIDANVFLQIGGWTNGPKGILSQRTFIPFNLFDLYKGDKNVISIFESNKIYSKDRKETNYYLTPTDEDLTEIGYNATSARNIQAVLQKVASFDEYDINSTQISIFLLQVKGFKVLRDRRMVLI